MNINKNDYELAINSLNVAIDLNPNFYETYYFKGQCLFKLGKFK